MTDQPAGPDVIAAADYLVSALAPAGRELDRWNHLAGHVTWSCRDTIAHVADCCVWYAALLARRAGGPVEVAEMSPALPPATLLDAVVSGAAVLAAVVTAAAPEDRAWHSAGIADRSGFAAMGADEILVHGGDVAAGLSISYAPPPDLCRTVLRRLFPWAPAEADASPWAGLLWANGRARLGNRLPQQDWKWHCAPLSEWDGAVPVRAARY